MCMCVVYINIYEIVPCFCLNIFSIFHHHYRRRRRRRFINIEISPFLHTEKKTFLYRKTNSKNTRIHARKQNTRIHTQTKKHTHTHATTKPTHNIAYIYMIDYKETRDIVSIEENRQLQTGISAEVLSAPQVKIIYTK